jgi:FtsP/CotA-like multicopper oxidase with cupredoxin domain
LTTLRQRILVTASLACLLLAAMEIATPAVAARPMNFNLFGSRSAGWGFTNTTVKSPGPLIEVEVGDNVTLNLTSLDGVTHRWILDYNNNSVLDPGEPFSGNFGTEVPYNFTVSNRTGTFVYRSDRGAGPGTDLTLMWGNITIRPAGTTSVGGANLLVIGGIAVVFVVILAIAVLSFRRQKEPPVPPPP